MKQRVFNPGFRLSKVDIAVLVVGSLAAVLVGVSVSLWLGVGIAFVVAHFFLFCNVVRAARPLELGWSAYFVALAAVGSLTDLLSWASVLLLTLPATLLVVVLELRKPSYHGIAWWMINPGLPDWWELHGNTGTFSD